MTFDQLIVKPATEAQAHEAVLRNAAHWGARARVSPEDYVKFTAAYHQAPFAQDGKAKTWVLAPQDDPDTTNFYASCLTITRQVLTLQPGQTSPTTCYGHGVSVVLVPPENRGKGYAKRLMSLLHSVLAPHRYPNPLNAPVATDHPSTVSILYSAVGDFYSHCVPAKGELGWTIQKSFITTWTVSSAQVPPIPSSSPVELLSESDVAPTLDADDANIPGDLLELQKKDPTKTYFACVPTSSLNTCSMVLSKLVSDSPSSPSWGAKIPGGRDFMIWVFFRRPKPRLVINRLRATVDSFPVLFGAALRVAQEAECEIIEAWSVPGHLEELVTATGGETTDRGQSDCPSCFKWYGQQSDPKMDHSDIVWALDERYSYC